MSLFLVAKATCIPYSKILKGIKITCLLFLMILLLTFLGIQGVLYFCFYKKRIALGNPYREGQSSDLFKGRVSPTKAFLPTADGQLPARPSSSSSCS